MRIFPLDSGKNKDKKNETLGRITIVNLTRQQKIPLRNSLLQKKRLGAMSVLFTGGTCTQCGAPQRKSSPTDLHSRSSHSSSGLCVLFNHILYVLTNSWDVCYWCDVCFTTRNERWDDIYAGFVCIVKLGGFFLGGWVIPVAMHCVCGAPAPSDVRVACPQKPFWAALYGWLHSRLHGERASRGETTTIHTPLHYCYKLL